MVWIEQGACFFRRRFSMIRIFIGTEPMQWLPTEVLKRSVQRRTKAKVEFQNLEGIPLKFKAIKMYTGFSFYRFSIPEKCGFQGRAIYLDADMVCLADIEELYQAEMKKPALAKTEDDGISFFTSTMLLDCTKLKHWKVHDWVALINAGLTSYQGCMSGTVQGMNHNDFAPLDPLWNDFDHYDEKTRLIHYTNVPTQPWKREGHPFRGAFLSELDTCLKEGSLTRQQVEEEIAKKHIYPTLLEDMEEYMRIGLDQKG
jgi:lipopolysaccharide biosynthesis glycosyltransferase